MTKRIVTKIVETDIKHEIAGTLLEVIKVLEKYVDKHGPDAALEIDDDVWEYGECYTRAVISVTRRETDEEETARKSAEAARKAATEARERDQWEKLNAKFGKKE